MSEKFTTAVIPHVKAGSFIDEQVDQFDAFAINWNGDEAIHLTFGRHSINVKTTQFVTENGISSIESGDTEIFRLDVGAITLPLDVAKKLAATLTNMIGHAEARRAKDE